LYLQRHRPINTRQGFEVIHSLPRSFITYLWIDDENRPQHVQRLARQSDLKLTQSVYSEWEMLVGREWWSCPSLVDTYPRWWKDPTMPRSHPSYPAEYRRKLVAPARSGRTIGSLAREYEPCANTISNWVKQADLDEGVRDDGLTTDERAEACPDGSFWLLIGEGPLGSDDLAQLPPDPGGGDETASGPQGRTRARGTPGARKTSIPASPDGRSQGSRICMVGETGFEPATSCSRTW